MSRALFQNARLAASFLLQRNRLHTGKGVSALVAITAGALQLLVKLKGCAQLLPAVLTMQHGSKAPLHAVRDQYMRVKRLKRT